MITIIRKKYYDILQAENITNEVHCGDTAETPFSLLKPSNWSFFNPNLNYLTFYSDYYYFNFPMYIKVIGTFFLESRNKPCTIYPEVIINNNLLEQKRTLRITNKNNKIITSGDINDPKGLQIDYEIAVYKYSTVGFCTNQSADLYLSTDVLASLTIINLT